MAIWTRELPTAEAQPGGSTGDTRRRVSMSRLVLTNPLARFGLVVIPLFILGAVFAGWIAPHRPNDIVKDAEGNWQMKRPPSREFLFGTTATGKDVFSQTVHGARIAFLVGVLSAVNVTVIGTLIGLLAGYFGGRLDEVLMRLTDVAYGIPFLPFAVVLVAVLGASFWNIVIAISVLLWRETARVIRAQVLTLRERAFVESARVAGARRSRVIFLHIAPQILPISLLYAVLAVGWAILTEAGLSFLGFGDPHFISWGTMLQDAYTSQALSQRMWWTVVPPGMCIAALLLSIFFVGQGIEEVVNPRLRHG